MLSAPLPNRHHRNCGHHYHRHRQHPRRLHPREPSRSLLDPIGLRAPHHAILSPSTADCERIAETEFTCILFTGQHCSSDSSTADSSSTLACFDLTTYLCQHASSVPAMLLSALLPLGSHDDVRPGLLAPRNKACSEDLVLTCFSLS